MPAEARSERRLPGRAVFIDKDGTLVEDVPYNVDPALLRFTPNAIDGLRSLRDAGYLIVIVTNQPGIALGLFDAAALDRLAQALEQRLADNGIVSSGFYACPHAPASRAAPEDALAASATAAISATSVTASTSNTAAAAAAAGCDCRKPAPGLLLAAARDLDISLPDSWMIGDILNDVEAGQRAGCRTVLLDVGNETEWLLSPARTPHHRVPDLRAAAQVILASDTAAWVDSSAPTPVSAQTPVSVSAPAPVSEPAPHHPTPALHGNGR